jgi:nicotinamide-nucleotide amidase
MSDTLEHRIRQTLDGRDDVRVATAESCTGGTIASRLTSQSGCSAYYVGSVVSYANDVKHRVLGVPEDVLESPGAVSEPCARAMVEGVRDLTHATHAVSTTGIAGPDGGTARKPVGTVYIGIATPEGTRVEHHVFPGDRASVIAAASDRALALLLEAIN